MKVVFEAKEPERRRIKDIKCGEAFLFEHSWHIRIMDFDDSMIGNYSDFYEVYASHHTLQREQYGVACIHLPTQHFIFFDEETYVDEVASIEAMLRPL